MPLLREVLDEHFLNRLEDRISEPCSTRSLESRGPKGEANCSFCDNERSIAGALYDILIEMNYFLYSCDCDM
jgi:hypothetical protein